MKNLPPLLWRSNCGKYRVRILRRCFRQMQRLAIQYEPNEIGSSLVGQYSLDGHEAAVLSVAPVTPDSFGSRWSFYRGVFGLRDFFESIRRRFRGRRRRVGEWHSHPDAPASPSNTDDTNQIELAAKESEQLPEAILLILGENLEKRPTLGVYVYSRHSGRITLVPS